MTQKHYSLGRKSVLSTLLAMLALAIGLLVVPTAGAARITSVEVQQEYFKYGESPGFVVNGTFAKKPPKSYTNTCGDSSAAEGFNWGPQTSKSSMWLQDNTQEWIGGAGNAKGGSCYGIILDSWSTSQVVFHFGSLFTSSALFKFGDHYVVGIDGYYYGDIAPNWAPPH